MMIHALALIHPCESCADASMIPSSSSSYRPDIDGLRGLAVLMVVLFHADMGFNGGYTGVDIFFVISGYLITGLLFKEMERGSIDLAGFWERRLRRITPALAVMLVVVLALGAAVLFPSAFTSLGESFVAQALLSANLYFWQDSGYFADAAEEKPLLHLWSLAVEEQFYILLPLLLIFGQHWLKRRHSADQVRWIMVRVFVGLMVVSFVASVVGVAMDANTAFYWLHTRAWELLLGSVLAGLPEAWRLKNRQQREVVAGLGLVLILVAAFAYESDTAFPGAAALLPCLGAAGLIWAHSLRAGEKAQAESLPRTWRVMTWKPLVAVGLISYSLYLWHWPLLALAQYVNIFGDNSPPVLIRVGAVLLAFLLAWMSWRWVEMPFRRKSIFKTRRSIFLMGAGLGVLFIVVGWQIVRHEGLPERMPEAAMIYEGGKQDRPEFPLTVDLEAVQQGQFAKAGMKDAEAPVAMMIWGDSHARSLMPVLDALCQEHRLTAEMAMYSATSPTLGFYRRSRNGLGVRTEILAKAVVERVRKAKIPNTLLAAYWSECPNKDPEGFSNALVETARVLTEAGTQVWVVLDVPTQPFDVPKALALGRLPGGWFPNPAERTTTLEKHREINAVMQALIPRLLETGARVLDPADLLMNADGRTLIEHDGHAVYVDYNHLTVKGAHLLRPLFEGLVSGSATPKR